MFEDEQTARAATLRWGDPARVDTIVEVALQPGAQTSRHDAEWITRRLGEPGAPDWMCPYLKGEPAGPAPSWELIMDGRALILGTRIREAAYDTVSSTLPDSLALLELARLGVELGSDLGLITAIVTREATHARIDYMMDVRDADGRARRERPWLAGAGAPVRRPGELRRPRTRADPCP